MFEQQLQRLCAGINLLRNIAHIQDLRKKKKEKQQSIHVSIRLNTLTQIKVGKKSGANILQNYSMTQQCSIWVSRYFYSPGK